MPTGSPVDLTQRVQQLLDERQKHVEALEQIDSALNQIRTALGGIGGAGNGRRPGRPRGRPPGSRSTSIAAGAAAPVRRRRGRQRFEVTGDDMILSMAGERGGATTQDIKRRWASEGRGGTADNSLSRLVKAGRLHRTPIEGQRGSRYTVA